MITFGISLAIVLAVTVNGVISCNKDVCCCLSGDISVLESGFNVILSYSLDGQVCLSENSSSIYCTLNNENACVADGAPVATKRRRIITVGAGGSQSCVQRLRCTSGTCTDTENWAGKYTVSSGKDTGSSGKDTVYSAETLPTISVTCLIFIITIVELA
jgi:hypothetical protein